MSKDIYCISDLHIGNGSYRDNFSENQLLEPLLEFINYVDRSKSELFILGDLFDFWMSSVGEVVENNSNLINILGDIGAKYVIGNHDIDILPLMSKKWLDSELFTNYENEKECEEIYRTINGVRFLFKHGHNSDPANSGTTPGKGRLWTIYAGIVKDQVEKEMSSNNALRTEDVEKVLLLIPEILSDVMHPFRDKIKSKDIMKVKSVYDFCDNMSELIEKVEIVYPYHESIYAALAEVMSSANESIEDIINELHRKMEEAAQSSEQETYDKLIVGHTHQAGMRGDWYYNTGHWGKRRLMTNEIEANVLKIDSQAKISFCNWDGKILIENKNAGAV